MSFEISADALPACLPLQSVSIEIVPIVGGKLSVAMQAMLLDEEELEFVGQELASGHVNTLDEALALIRQNVSALDAHE